MRAAGAEVACVQADVADVSRMREVIEEIGQEGRELRGIIHAAGVLDDGVLMGQKWARFERVMRGKVMGAWNLAELTRGKELDFFVMFSSAASLLGSPGQGNYAAANAYLDGLAAARERRGEVGLSINWGAWGEVGLAAHEHVARNIAGLGMQSMRSAEALIAFWRVMERRKQGQMAVMAVDWAQLLALLPVREVPRMVLEIIEDKPSKEKIRQTSQWQAFRRQLEIAPNDRRLELLTDHVRNLIAQVLRMNSSQSLDVNRNFLEIGMDSLIGLEVRNRLEVSLGVPLSAKLLWDHPTIDQLATHLASIKIPSAAAGKVHALNGDPKTATNQQQLSPDQAKALSMLLTEIESINE